MELNVEAGCKVCHKYLPLSDEGLCGRCQHFVEVLRDKKANAKTDPGPKPRGRRPHCPGCGKTCVPDIDDFSGDWAFFCPGPCVEYCWKCQKSYPEDTACPCGAGPKPRNHGLAFVN